MFSRSHGRCAVATLPPLRLRPTTSTSDRRGAAPALSLICALFLGALLAGCGGGDDTSTSTSSSQTTTAAGGGGGDGGGGDDTSTHPALGPAEAKESVDQAQQRIADALDSKDCDQINELNPLSRPSLDTPERCAYLQRLAGLKVSGAKEYGPAGGVIDYEQGNRIVSAVLVVDSDGLYHVAFLNPFNDKPTVGTPYAKEFDKAAADAVKAFKDGDCDAYQEVVFRRSGRGTKSAKDLCAYVESNPVSNLLEAVPDAQLAKSGGNDAYAFFTLGTPGANLTLVMAREQEEGAPPKAPALPKGAAEFAYVDAYRTNEGGGSE